MPSTLWLFLLPLGSIPVVYFLRRLRLGGVIAALVALLSAWLAVRLPTGIVLNLLGRSIELDRLSQISLSLLFVTTAVLFLISPDSAERTGEKRGLAHGLVRGREGRIFYPVGLATLGFFVAASLSRHLGITAIFIECAAILTVFIIQGERLESTRAALRFLTLMSLATPLFLLAAWRLDLYQLSGELDTSSNLWQIYLFLGLGFAVWLAVVPLHGWLTATAAESAPPTAGFVLVVFPVVGLSTLVHLMLDFPQLVDSPQIIQVVAIAGIVTALVGGLLASIQRGFSELMGYAALFDLGCTLTILGSGGQDEVLTILFALIVRALALTLLVASSLMIRQQTASDGFAQVRGIAYQMPLAMIGLTIGGLTLAGAPLTAGFILRWHLFQSVAALDSRWPVLLVLASLGVMVGYLRGLGMMLTPGEKTRAQKRQPYDWVALAFQQPLSLLLVVCLLGITCLLLGIFPGLLIERLQSFLTEAPVLLQ